MFVGLLAYHTDRNLITAITARPWRREDSRVVRSIVVPRLPRKKLLRNSLIVSDLFFLYTHWWLFLEIITYVYSVFGVEAGDLTSTTTGLDLDSMLDRSDSDLSTNDARTIRKQLEGLENMYSEVRRIFIENFEILIFSIFFFSYSNNILYHVMRYAKRTNINKKENFFASKGKRFHFSFIVTISR